MESKVTQRTNPARPQKLLIGSILLFYIATSTFLIVVVHFNLWPTLSSRQLFSDHILVASFGMLGATTACIRRYYKALITEDEISNPDDPRLISWGLGRLYYFSVRPLIGAIVSAMIFSFCLFGIQSVVKLTGNAVFTLQGKLLLIGLAYIAGYNASPMLDKIDRISTRIFS